jgi:hypothetical protein
MHYKYLDAIITSGVFRVNIIVSVFSDLLGSALPQLRTFGIILSSISSMAELVLEFLQDSRTSPIPLGVDVTALD